MNEELSKIIFDLIGETYMSYDVNQVIVAVSKCVTENHFKGFTNKNKNTRTKVINKLKLMGEECTEGTLNYTFFEGVIDCYVDNLVSAYTLSEYVPKNNVERDVLVAYNRFKTHPRCKELLRQQVIVKKEIDSMYLGNAEVLKVCLADMLGIVMERYANQKQLEKPSLQMYNQKFHAANTEKVRGEMISGLTYAKEGSLEIGNMSANTSIGRKRKNQEDAVLIKEHPQNPNFKILVVADGVGGGDFGEIVSDYTISHISKWFENLPVVYYKNSNGVANALTEEIQNISSDMYQRFNGRGGSTFVGGVVCENETVISNIGDSRAYMYSAKNKELKQVSQDDSMVEVLYKTGEISRREDMRFHIQSHRILQSIGDASKVIPRIKIVSNKSYDKLILVSDGVSDCLSDKTIWAITQRTPREQLAQKLVESALNVISYARPELSREFYNAQITGGKDNTTVAVLDKKEKSRRGDEYDV